MGCNKHLFSLHLPQEVLVGSVVGILAADLQ